MRTIWVWGSWRLWQGSGCPWQLTGNSPCTAVKSIRGEYYLNGHWTIEAARALPVASTILHYERGTEGDLAPEQLHARGPTSEPLVIEVSWAGRRGLWGTGVPGPQEVIVGPQA